MDRKKTGYNFLDRGLLTTRPRRSDMWSVTKQIILFHQNPVKFGGYKLTSELMRNGENEPDRVNLIVRKIARESPQLKDLNWEQLETIAKIVITQRLTKEMDGKASVAEIDLNAEIDAFIKQAGRTESAGTKAVYREAIATLTRWARKNKIEILLMDYAQADDFIYSLSGAPKTVRLKIAAVSSFFSFLERRHSAVKNPVRGTRARPQDKTVRELEIPTDEEMPVILESLPDYERLAVCVMAYRGLRVGALNRLKIWGNGYQAVSKGKEIYGEFPEEIMRMIKASPLNNKSPFGGCSIGALKVRIIRATGKLHREGKISAPYSAHDFRHYFAVSNYQRDKDIYRLSKLLDHSNIAITENYLKGLKIPV
jgi:integrase